MFTFTTRSQIGIMIFKTILLFATYATVFCMESSDFISKCDYNAQDKFINCENVKIGNLEDNIFYKDPAILCLYLQNTGLTVIQPNAFINLPQLLLIDLRNNLLTDLDYRVFSMLNELRSLFLFDNKLTSLNDNRIFASQRNLIYLNLDNNMLTTLTVDVLQPMTSLSQLHLEGNPFMCSSDMNFTIQWCRMRSSVCTVDCSLTFPRSDMGKELDVTPPEDVTPVAATTVIKGETQHTSLYNVTHKVVINNHSDTFHYQTLLIVVALLSIIVALLCFAFGAFWFYRRREATGPNPTNTNAIRRIWRFHARNENEYTRNYLSVIPDPPARPHLVVPQKQYDDILNVVKEEAEYVSYITPDSS